MRVFKLTGPAYHLNGRAYNSFCSQSTIPSKKYCQPVFNEMQLFCIQIQYLGICKIKEFTSLDRDQITRANIHSSVKISITLLFTEKENWSTC